MGRKEKKVRKNTIWQRQFLIIAGIVELALCIPSLLFTIFFAYQGFIAGEMGNMIGLFSIAIVLFLLPYVTARAAAVHGLIKRKRWAAVISIILSGLFLLGAIFSAIDFPVLSAMVLLYTSFSLWAAVKYLGHTNLKKQGDGRSKFSKPALPHSSKRSSFKVIVKQRHDNFVFLL